MNALLLSNPPTTSCYSTPFLHPWLPLGSCSSSSRSSLTNWKPKQESNFRSWVLRPPGSVRGAVLRPPRCSMDVALGGGTDESYSYGNVPKFPRMHVWDPYERLGVSRYASEEEIREARNFLLGQYAGHESSEESIEAAYEKILMTSFRERKRSKINLKSRLKKKVEESPPWVKTLLDYVELPTTEVILKRFFLFAFMGGWSIMNSADTGPAFQVLLSLLSCIYFLNEKMKSLKRASLTGLGALVVGWIVGSIAVPMIPTFLLQPTWTLELLTSLISYVFLFLACTFLK